VVRFLFWNLNRRPLQRTLANLVRTHDIDVLMLAECEVSTLEMLSALNESGDAVFQSVRTRCQGLAVYSRFSPEYLRPTYEAPDHLTVLKVLLPARQEILLAVAHLPSKLRWSGDSQALECTNVARRLRDVEARVGHARTVLVGDLNMNPFEFGVVSATGLHAVMSREVASRGSRKVLKESYPFFYNPMWGHFGDALDGPPGTYYYEQGQHVEYFWHMFDQVLIRPELLACFRNESLQILTAVGDESFVSKSGRPRKSGTSDHLPIVFRLDF
jgi:exonuclease III